MADKIKIGIIGAGAIARVTHTPIWNSMEDVELIAVCDVAKKKA